MAILRKNYKKCEYSHVSCQEQGRSKIFHFLPEKMDAIVRAFGLENQLKVAHQQKRF